MKRYRKPGDIKVGVIGYGGSFNMGRHHMREMQRAGMRPFAVCELDPQRLAAAEEDFPGIQTYDSLDRMLRQSDVDLVTHITPHHLHYPLAAKCVRAGKHVVTEKPFVVTTRQADNLIALAKKHDVMVSTYHNRHWDGWILRARRQIVDKGVIGDVFRVDAQRGTYEMPRDWWRTSRSVSGGILYDWGVHLLEYALQIIPSQMTEVSGFAQCGYWPTQMKDDHPWKNDCNEDEATAVVRFENGAMLSLTVSQLESDGRPYQIGFFGTRGCYLINFRDGWTLRTANRKGELVETTGKHPPNEGHRYYQNVADFLTGKADLIITPEWARRPIHILDLAGRSAAAGKALRAKYG